MVLVEVGESVIQENRGIKVIWNLEFKAADFLRAVSRVCLVKGLPSGTLRAGGLEGSSNGLAIGDILIVLQIPVF